MKEMKEIERKKEIAKKEMERKINKEQIAKILRKDMKEMILINTSRSSSLSSNAKLFENSLISCFNHINQLIPFISIWIA